MAKLPILYVPNVRDGFLPEEEARHAHKVLRLNEGDELRLVDGKGGIYKARISEIGKKEARFRIEEEKQGFGKRPFRLTVAVSPTKNDQRFEWFLEKATEMGIERIVPVICARTEKDRIKRERFERILIAAMKQSVKAYLPVLEDPMTLDELLKEEGDEERFVAHCYKKPQKELLQDVYRKGHDAKLLIGPEGDLTAEEVEHAVEQGYQPVSLGKATLRTETAAVAACHTIALLNEGN